MQRIILLNGSVLTASLVEVRVPPRAQGYAGLEVEKCVQGGSQNRVKCVAPCMLLDCMKAKDKVLLPAP